MFIFLWFIKFQKLFKALSKQGGPNVCWDARFLNPFIEFESAACCKKRFQKTSIPRNVWPFLFCQGFSKDYLNTCQKSEELIWYTFLFQLKKTWINRVKDTAKLHGFTLKTQLNWKLKQVRFFYKTDWVMNQAGILITVVWTLAKLSKFPKRQLFSVETTTFFTQDHF